MKGICANVPQALGRTDSLSCQSLGFSVEARYSTKPVVERELL